MTDNIMRSHFDSIKRVIHGSGERESETSFFIHVNMLREFSMSVNYKCAFNLWKEFVYEMKRRTFNVTRYFPKLDGFLCIMVVEN